MHELAIKGLQSNLIKDVEMKEELKLNMIWNAKVQQVGIAQL